MLFNRYDEMTGLSKLYKSLKKIDGKSNVEKKPTEFKVSKNDHRFNDFKRLNVKEKNSLQINENKIICDNIITKFLELNDEKFMACLERIMTWGFDICFREFILNYYLYIKKSNSLRQYVIMNLNEIITMLHGVLEDTLLMNLKNFNFENYKDYEEVEFIKNDLRNREAALLPIKAKNFNEFASPSEERKELLSNDKRKSLRSEILNRLRYENPMLEEDF